MKQVVQNYRSGELRLEDVPVPICRQGGVLVRSAFSLVSAGTERMKVNQARMSLLQMAKARPDKVKQVLTNVKQVGILETVAKVRERLDTLTPLGYSLAGMVEQVGSGLDEFRVGDRVACAGEGIACHAEFVFVPKNLCVPVLKGVELCDAAFATVGAVALNGVRQAGVTIGDSVVVIGLGLVGLLGVQILKAAGCQVVGIDLDPHKVDLAKKCGADHAFERQQANLEEAILHATAGRGADVVYIAASTQSTDPMELAGRIARDRGRVVIVGMIKVEADWQTYYQKELSVILSRSYGPGRYDRNYESRGIDYPIGHVRWTLRRNLEEFIHLLQTKSVRPKLLAPAVFPLEQAPEAYDQLHKNPGKHAVGILFEYPKDAQSVRQVPLSGTQRIAKSTSSIGFGVIGAGNFATGTLIPALKRLSNARLVAICSAGGLSARSAGDRHGFSYCTSDVHDLFQDKAIDAVIIATRHDTHARFAAEALLAGKHVFVEKPLALNSEQVEQLSQAHANSPGILMLGFNRRFSPLSEFVRAHFAKRTSPMEVVCRINAGSLGQDSWYSDANEGGWRIISEGCHFVDLIQFLVGHPIIAVHAQMIGGHVGGRQHDNCIATLRLRDGSIASLIYVANGDPCFEKERIEVFGQGSAAVIENWQVARISTNGKIKKLRGSADRKGHAAELAAFAHAIQNGDPSPIPFDDAVCTTLTTFEIAAGLTSGLVRPVSPRSKSLTSQLERHEPIITA
ncbi:MAG: bi-domain-containing oxidoreductase [Planctomycetota bacterium]